MKRLQQFILTAAVVTLPMLFVVPMFPVHATVTEDISKGLKAAGGTAYEKSTPDIAVVIGILVNAALGLLGALLLVYLIMAGFLWMTAGGDDTKVKKARDMIKNAVIGIVIIAASMAIATTVLTALGPIATGGNAVSPPPAK